MNDFKNVTVLQAIKELPAESSLAKDFDSKIGKWMVFYGKPIPGTELTARSPIAMLDIESQATDYIDTFNQVIAETKFHNISMEDYAQKFEYREPLVQVKITLNPVSLEKMTKITRYGYLLHGDQRASLELGENVITINQLQWILLQRIVEKNNNCMSASLL